MKIKNFLFFLCFFFIEINLYTFVNNSFFQRYTTFVDSLGKLHDLLAQRTSLKSVCVIIAAVGCITAFYLYRSRPRKDKKEKKKGLLEDNEENLLEDLFKEELSLPKDTENKEKIEAENLENKKNNSQPTPHSQPVELNTEQRIETMEPQKIEPPKKIEEPPFQVNRETKGDKDNSGLGNEEKLELIFEEIKANMQRTNFRQIETAALAWCQFIPQSLNSSIFNAQVFFELILFLGFAKKIPFN
jgi:hypothetical protein